MVDGVRAFLNRPLRDSDRPRLFAIAVALVLAAAALLAMLDDPPSPQSEAEPAEPSPMPTTAGLPAASSVPLVSEEAPSEEANPPAALEASSAHVTQAKQAARRFLAGYLPYAYGQRDARQIAHASPQLRRRLASERPRVPPAERRRRPRLVLLQADSVGRSRAGMRAQVTDGERRYTVPLRLERTAGGWVVTALGT
jgi:Family of unknown function (DUF6459)